MKMGFLVYELGFRPKLAWELGFEAWELGFGPKLGWELGFRTALTLNCQYFRNNSFHFPELLAGNILSQYISKQLLTAAA